MREIEVLVRCDDSLTEILAKMKDFKYISKERIIDTYYFDELRSNLKPNAKLRLSECFRIREKEKKSVLTYKVDKFTEDDIWLYSDEFESEVENSESTKKIINLLGLRELIKIDNTKIKYENDLYELYIEDVVGLGIFFEVEIKEDANEDVEVIKNRIREFIKTFNLTNVVELNEGKPELMLKNQLI